MKMWLCLVLMAVGIPRGFAEPVPADPILAFVREHLPSDPLKLSGSLKVQARNGFTKANLPVDMELDWGAETPKAVYRIGDESMTITWNNDVPGYAFSNPKTTPTSEILDSGMTWADLSFSVLWWPNSRLIGEDSKINRKCHVVDVPIPGSGNTMRLWIEQEMGMLLEAQTLDPKGNQLRRLKIKSIKKMDGMWVAKDLELRDMQTGSKTTLEISDLQWKDSKPTAEAFDPAESVNAFTFDLYREVSTRKGNLFLSPYSISSAMAMVYSGARGETAAQMNETLHLGGPGATHPAFSFLREKLNGIQAAGNVQLSIANSLWPQKEYAFLPDYLESTKAFYGVEIEAVDFIKETEAARQKINAWAEEKTNGLIKDLIPEGMLEPMTRLVLANAIHFKGNWASQFNAERTRPAPFQLAGGGMVEVPTMMQTATFGLAHADGFRALELPYEGEELSMIVLLPDQSDGLDALESNLSLELVNDLPFNVQQVMVQLPRFKLEWEMELGKTLAGMGMPLAFSSQADLSGMDGSKELSIGFVMHKAFVEVNEEGTEAAAATAVGIRATSMPTIFAANQPFLFLIRENSTGTILFIGRVTDPR